MKLFSVRLVKRATFHIPRQSSIIVRRAATVFKVPRPATVFKINME